jgi:hypothetical protein
MVIVAKIAPLHTFNDDYIIIHNFQIVITIKNGNEVVKPKGRGRKKDENTSTVSDVSTLTTSFHHSCSIVKSYQ